MGNLFIGFPVPRARIAEMIEGAAPPLEHKENHEPDGSDPLSLPGDISTNQILQWNGTKFVGTALPSAGAPFPFDAINIGATFEDYQGYAFVGSEGDEYYVDVDGLTLHWTSGSSETITCIRKLFGNDAIPVWNKEQRFDVALRSWSAAPEDYESFCCRGKPGDNCFGFFTTHGDLYGMLGNVAEGSDECLILSAAQWNGHNRILSARLYPDTFTCKFYVNGVYIDQVVSEEVFPTTSDYLDHVFYMDLLALNVNDYTICNYWNFWQEF